MLLKDVHDDVSYVKQCSKDVIPSEQEEQCQ